MVTLSTALNYSIAGMSIATAQTAIASRNVAGAQDPGYSRRSADIVSLPGGMPSAATLTRSADRRLLEKLQEFTSSASAQKVTQDALQAISGIMGDTDSESSIASLIGKLQSSVRDAESDPGSFPFALAIVDTARQLAGELNRASAGVQDLRQQADREVSAAVDRVNALLSQFQVANGTVVRGSGTPSELADALDERDRILKLLSEEIGVRTITGANNSISIYTSGGATLFETVPRQVRFEATSVLAAGVSGSTVTVDGVDISEGASLMRGGGGALAAQLAVRDRLGPDVQSQLDEIARGLVELFAERGADGAMPASEGLFVSGLADVPPAGVLSAGLASQLHVNAMAAENPFLVRDGGFGGSAYVQNGAGQSAFQARLSGLQSGFDISRPFAAEARIETDASLKAFSVSARGWVESQRQSADEAATAASTRMARASDALSRVAGVNIDEEMAAILDLEKSYQASAKIFAAVGQMLTSLLEAV